MKIVRAPLRVSLFGGGTDRPSYYERYGSTIISFAINRHIYVIWNDRPTGGCRLSYSEVEELESLRDAKHTLVKAVSVRYGIPEPCTLTITSDLPKGTGLGSSSALAVCLCELVEEQGFLSSVKLEQSVSPEVGFQDHLPAMFGGFQTYQWEDGKIPMTDVGQPGVTIINTCGLLLYTGITRQASDILPNWNETPYLHSIHTLAQSQVSLRMFWSLESLGAALDETWGLKSQIPGVCTEKMHWQYATAIGAGALGGKLCGAGGGGCWFFIVLPSKRQRVIDALGLTEIPFKVAREGVRSWEL